MTKHVYVKNLKIGGGAPVSVQSMTDTLTSDYDATIARILELANAGCDLVRVSVPDTQSVASLRKLVNNSPIPIVADVHYDYKLSLASLEAGVHKLRVNPSNITKDAVKLIATEAKSRNVPIRIGVNAGSSQERLSPKALAELAVDTAKLMEDSGTDQLVLAVKSSNVRDTVEAYRELSKLTDYPLHIGLTEAGTENLGITKSSIAIGSLLLDGIGDTLRVSLTANPVREVEEGRKILRAIGLQKDFVEVIACPTCARTQIEVEKFAKQVELATAHIRKPLKIAVMGCSVNGIGESKGADFGVCGGKQHSLIFKNGEIIKTVDNDCVLQELLKLAEVDYE